MSYLHFCQKLMNFYYFKFYIVANLKWIFKVNPNAFSKNENAFAKSTYFFLDFIGVSNNEKIKLANANLIFSFLFSFFLLNILGFGLIFKINFFVFMTFFYKLIKLNSMNRRIKFNFSYSNSCFYFKSWSSIIKMTFID